MEGFIQQIGQIQEQVLFVNRVSKKTKGGDRPKFSALVVVGDKNGRVGLGYGKAPELRSAIAKATEQAKKRMFQVPIQNDTIPRRIEIKEGAAEIILMPAPRGAGLIAGSVVKPILELAGIKNASCKIVGTDNPVNNAKATIKALEVLSREAGLI